jgi:HNH endonuclease
MSEYAETFEQNEMTTRIVVCTPSIGPNSDSLWFNTSRPIRDLLRQLLSNHTLFRAEGVPPDELADTYQVYGLAKPLSLDHPIIVAIKSLPRNDRRTNEFIEQLLKREVTFADRFSETLHVVASRPLPTDPVVSILHPTLVVHPLVLNPYAYRSTSIVIGVPMFDIKLPAPSAFDYLQSMTEYLIREWISWRASRGHGEQSTFKKEVVKYYDAKNPVDSKSIYDSGLGIFLPSDLVSVGHIFKQEWRSHWTTLWGEEKERAWDVRNGILWNRAIERAFDDGRITVYEQDTALKFHVLDPLLKKIPVAQDLIGKEDDRKRMAGIIGAIKFEDLEGKELSFRNSSRPFRRCLCLHAQVTRRAAIEKGWQREDDWEVEGYYSDDIRLDIARFLSQVSTYTAATRMSIDPLPEESTNDAIFQRANILVRRR